MTMTENRPETADIASADVIGQEWLDAFATALRDPALERLEDLLADIATWRDFMGFTWDVTNYLGRDAVLEGLERLVPAARPSGFVMSPRQAPLEADGHVLLFFDFETDHRLCRGHARLARSDGGSWRAITLMTHIEEIAGHPPRLGQFRPDGKTHGYVPDRTRWSDERRRTSEFENADPQVLVLGAGHNGLAVGARLGVLGIPTLIIERNKRVGDNWRRRYASLALHSLIGADHLPYFPFPPTWTAHTPKDKFADHLESYANALDLNVWTETTMENAEYDEAEHRWTITLRRGDGSTRVVRPAHLVIAAGLNGTPKIPHVEDLDKFQGVAVHSGEFQGGADYPGKKVLVVGAGVSAHEIAHDLHEHGADVTIMQRSATYVINFTTFNNLWYGVYTEGSPLAPEEGDMVAYGTPNVTNREVNRQLVKMAAEIDKDLLDALEARGFKLEWGPEGTGIIGSHMAGRDSYQINIGASDLVADGSIGLKQGVELVRTTPTGAVFSDGSEMDVDLIVFATGYHDMWETMRPVLGDAAAKVRKVYGLAEDGEYAETWRRSRQPGLWFATGFVTMARFHSKPMTLLIKAIEEGLVPYDPADGGPEGS